MEEIVEQTLRALEWCAMRDEWHQANGASESTIQQCQEALRGGNITAQINADASYLVFNYGDPNWSRAQCRHQISQLLAVWNLKAGEVFWDAAKAKENLLEFAKAHGAPLAYC